MSLKDPMHLARLLAAAIPLGLAGCGDESLDELGEFDDEVCIPPDEVGDLAPAGATDYIAVRRRVGEETWVIASWGTACATASDADACAAALSGLAMETPLVHEELNGVVDHDVAITRADEVLAIGDRAALLALLGEIDTAGEALLVAFADGQQIPCGEKNVRKEGGSWVLHGTSGTTCGGDLDHFLVTVDADGTVHVGETLVVEEGDDSCAIGRRPVGLCGRVPRARSVGRFFANAARLEAASIHAFAVLARELAAHGAPAELVAACLRARQDEVRHTRACSRLARRFGVEPLLPIVRPVPLRDLFSVAHDNATEGCVRETFGAATAHVQARTARDAEVRGALRRIAADETEHATLSWQIDAWARTRLSRGDRARLDSARAQAVRLLHADVSPDPAPAIRRVAGMPRGAAQQRMIRALGPSLWGVGLPAA